VTAPGGVVVLAGGTGGAKLAAGLQSVLGERLTVIANTADDIDALGVHVSPDPDLCTYWLTGEIDEARGWGVAGDSFTVFERLVALGAESWFSLGDHDLATCLRRRHLLDQGLRPTEAQRAVSAGAGAVATVLPMCDEPVRARVRTPEGWLGLQEFMVRERGEPSIEGVEFEGLAEALLTPEIEAALAGAETIVVGPSNPVISIGPILDVAGMRAALAAAPAPVVAVSPFVAGAILKGPTFEFMEAVGLRTSTAGVVDAYAGVIDGIVVDSGDPDPPPSLPHLVAPTLMSDEASRRELAERTLEFAASLRRP
jgi:LPPG:FO 2-phospho-L-lactate transferase